MTMPRLASTSAVSLVLLALALVGCQKAQPQHQLSLSYDFWYDHLEWSLVDLDGATILERRFHDRQDLLLGQHEYTRQSDGKTYVNEYVADLTWEALKVESPERDRPVWVISHLECEFEATTYRVDRLGRRVRSGSLAYRQNSNHPWSGPFVLSHDELNQEHDEFNWAHNIDLYNATSNAPTMYVHESRSTRASLVKLLEAGYNGVRFDTNSLRSIRIRNTSNGLASDWADDVVKCDLFFYITPLGEVVVCDDLEIRPMNTERFFEKDYFRNAAFIPGPDVKTVQIQTTHSDGTDPF